MANIVVVLKLVLASCFLRVKILLDEYLLVKYLQVLDSKHW